MAWADLIQNNLINLYDPNKKYPGYYEGNKKLLEVFNYIVLYILICFINVWGYYDQVSIIPSIV